MAALVLDTNVIRNLGTGDVSPRIFTTVLGVGISVHLSDTAASEVAAALATGRMAWNEWVRARGMLRDLLDLREPVLLSGGAGLARAGVQHPTRKIGNDGVAAALAAHRERWTFVVEAVSPEVFDAERFSAVIANERAAWIREFTELREAMKDRVPTLQEEIPRRGDSIELLERIVSVLQRGADQCTVGSPPAPSVRLDAFLRTRALLLSRHLRKHGSYNPRKSSNDLFDHFLLRYLALPAAICTDDRRLIADVGAARSWQRQWVVRPCELREPAVVAALADLSWDAATAGTGSATS